MHVWDMMSNGKDDTNWCGSTTIKSEPSSMDDGQQKSHMLNGDSNPTSPHSIGSDESATHPPNIFYDTVNNILNGNHLHRPHGFNPLTPPGYPNPNVCVPQTLVQQQLPTTPTRGFRADTTNYAMNSVAMTPSHSPPIDHTTTPPKSPKFRSDVSEKDGTDLDSISGDENKSVDSSDYAEEIRAPKVNSHGKVKEHKCKHCDFVSVTKVDFWEHSRIHIKPERMIQCTQCPFVTEYKHHFEYHLRNHQGSKPFKCPECAYSCVNKSMLNSHLKSHSDIYQYHCENCSYATKYVHSLKLHLRKYEHSPAVPLDMDGVPDPTPIIDVYGTRRGPKKRSHKLSKRRAAAKANQKTSKADDHLQQLQQQQQQIQKQQQEQNNQLQKQEQEQYYQLRSQQQQQLQNFFQELAMYKMGLNPQHAWALPLNFFPASHTDNIDDDEEVEMSNVQKFKKLEITNPESPSSSVPNTSHNHACDESMVANESHHEKKTTKSIETTKQPEAPWVASHDCNHCHISFADVVLHSIHMRYHSYNDPFKCNYCGEKTEDSHQFWLHIAKKAHQ